jgi:hypothetical protein
MTRKPAREQINLFTDLIPNQKPVLVPTRGMSNLDKVLMCIDQSMVDGLACFEAETKLRLPHQIVSARFLDLRRRGSIVPKVVDGVTVMRPTRFKRPAIVYVTKKFSK